MQNKNSITVQTVVNAPIDTVWTYWNEPEHITQWAFASDDWECPAAKNDLREGGTFTTTMAAKDGSARFDVIGTYTAVREHEVIEYDMSDCRHVKIEFMTKEGQTEIIETFDPEQENPAELQRDGWQAILDNFKKYVETQR